MIFLLICLDLFIIFANVSTPLKDLIFFWNREDAKSAKVRNHRDFSIINNILQISLFVCFLRIVPIPRLILSELKYFLVKGDFGKIR